MYFDLLHSRDLIQLLGDVPEGQPRSDEAEKPVELVRVFLDPVPRSNTYHFVDDQF
jgi:hypothetical protein